MGRILDGVHMLILHSHFSDHPQAVRRVIKIRRRGCTSLELRPGQAEFGLSRLSSTAVKCESESDLVKRGFESECAVAQLLDRTCEG